MADPEVPARTPAKRKRCATPIDPKEVAELIVDGLETAREEIDKKLAKYSDSILQAQSRKRRQFINYCESAIRGLPDGIRSSVATSLLSSEDFDVKMNFSEMHTSSSKYSLTWSCGDASLSDPSWKKLLQQFSEGAAESFSPSTGELAHNFRATRKSSSSPGRLSLLVSESAGPSTSATMAEDYDDLYAVPEDEDPLSTPHVTISKTRKRTNTGPRVALPSHKAGPKKGTRGTFSQPTQSKEHNPRLWTKKEIKTLRSLCDGKPEAHSDSKGRFWKSVQTKMLGRTAAACSAKWRTQPGFKETPKPIYDGSNRQQTWSAEERAKLEQFRPRAGEPIRVDRKLARALFPERTINSVISRCNRQFFGPRYQYFGTHPVGSPATTADEFSGESLEGGVSASEDEDQSETGSDGGTP